MLEISETQLRYLSFIHAYTEGFGIPPAESEIAKAMKVQPPSVNGMLKKMEIKQFIRRKPSTPRSIEILVDAKMIPAWKKKMVSSFQFYAPKTATKAELDHIMERMISHRKTERNETLRQDRIAKQTLSATNSTVYRFKITLNNSKPPIWRRIETLDVLLSDFHYVIQAAMGWTNSHLHAFNIAGVQFIDRKLLDDNFGASDYMGIRLSELVLQHGPKLKMRYDYDFGDGWMHSVVLEKVIDRTETAIAYPRCVAGRRACPPEDVGGAWGFADFLEAINDPAHEQHDELLDWSGPFSPEELDLDETTQRMQECVRSVCNT